MVISTAAAIVLGAGAIATSGALAARSQAKAAKNAANIQAQSASQALDAQERIYQDQKATLTPTALSGAQARARQMQMLGFSTGEVNDYLKSQYAAFGRAGEAPSFGDFDAGAFLRSQPGYQFQLGEGQRAIERSAAARGGLLSGGAGRALERYGQDYASTKYDDLFNKFGGLGGSGDRAAGTTVNVAGAFGDAQRNLILAQGDARASGVLGSGKAWGNFWGNTVPGAIGWGFGNWPGNGNG